MENDFNPTGITGLAMIVGQLRAELDRLRDDTNRDLATIRTELAEEIAARDAINRDTFATVSGIAELVKPVATTANPPGPAGGQPRATEAVPTPLPTLSAGERPSEYHKRVAAWAKANGEEPPPKPPVGPTANGRAYAEKVARFYAAD